MNAPAGMLRWCTLLVLAAGITAQISIGTSEINMLQQCGGTSTLTLGKTGDDCVVSGVLTNKQEQRLTVSIAENANFDLLLTFRTASGIAKMFVYTPGADTTGQPSFAAEELYSTNITQESYVSLPGSVLRKNPGTYTIMLVPVSATPVYDLYAQVQSMNIRLVDDELQALRDLMADCCDGAADRQGPGVKSWCGTYLPAAAQVDRADEDDICHKPPNLCNVEGRLVKLMMPNGDLSCYKFPYIRGFTMLQSLDLSGNKISTDVQALTDEVIDTPIRRLFMRKTGMTGQLNCDLLMPQMTHLSLATNNIEGTIPACYLQSQNLEELYLSRNALSGTLPEFNIDGKLRTFMAFQQQGEGLTGQLPQSLINATSLKFFSVAGNSLSGSIWRLPKDMVYFNVSDNYLSGLPDYFPASIAVVDMHSNELADDDQHQFVFAPSDMTTLVLSYNRLSGSIPRLPGNLQVLDLAQNNFTGDIPNLPSTLESLKLSSNQLSGQLPAASADMEVADFSQNQLSGMVPESYASASKLQRLDVSGNQLTSLPESWSAAQLRYLNTSHNTLSGALPTALASLPRIHQIDLSSNGFTDGLPAFLRASRDNAGNEVAVAFNISHNALTGPVPNEITSLAFFRPDTAVWESEDGLSRDQLQHVLDISNNDFDSEYPATLLDATAKLVATCKCNVTMKLMGGGNKIRCPADSNMAPEAAGVITQLKLKCVDAQDQVVYVASRERVGSFLDTGAPAAAVSAASNGSANGTAAGSPSPQSPIDIASTPSVDDLAAAAEVSNDDASYVFVNTTDGVGTGTFNPGHRKPGSGAVTFVIILISVMVIVGAFVLFVFMYRKFNGLDYKPSAQARYDHLERGDIMPSSPRAAARQQVKGIYRKATGVFSRQHTGYEKMKDSPAYGSQVLADYQEPKEGRKLQDVPLHK